MTSLNLPPLLDPNGNLVPRFGLTKLVTYMTGDSLSTVRRNVANHPELGRQNGRHLDIDIWLYLRLKDALPRPSITIHADRPGPFARAAAQREAEAAANHRQPARRRTKSPQAEPATA